MEELDATVADLSRNKVDKATYFKKIEFVEGQLYQMMRRLTNGEEDTYRFGEFVLKY